MGEFSIRISNDFVTRLSNEGEKLKKKTKRTKPKAPREKQLHDSSETNKTTASPGWPAQSPLFFPVTQPVQPAIAELEAIRSVNQETERVLEKLKKQEDNMVQQVTERAKDLRDKEFKLPYQKPMPCLADHDACLSCYKEHADDVLKCGPLIRSYHECVRRAKQQMSSTDN